MATILSYTDLLFPDYDASSSSTLSLSAWLPRPNEDSRGRVGGAAIRSRSCNRCGCELAPMTPALFCQERHSPTHKHGNDELPCNCPLMLVLCGDCMPKDRVPKDLVEAFKERLARFEQADSDARKAMVEAGELVLHLAGHGVLLLRR